MKKWADIKAKHFSPEQKAKLDAEVKEELARLNLPSGIMSADTNEWLEEIQRRADFVRQDEEKSNEDKDSD